MLTNVLGRLSKVSGFQHSFFLNPGNKSATAENCKEYIKTKPESWIFLQDGDAGRIIESIPFIGESVEFSENNRLRAYRIEG